MPSWRIDLPPGNGRWKGKEMTLFYRGPCVRITDKAFEVRHPRYRAFAIHRLQQVCVAEPAGISGVGTATTSCCGVVGLMAAGAAQGWPFADVPAIWGVAIVMAAVPWLAVLRRPIGEPYRLLALYDGEPVCLFETHDRILFGQVRRALLRALEWREDYW